MEKKYYVVRRTTPQLWFPAKILIPQHGQRSRYRLFPVVVWSWFSLWHFPRQCSGSNWSFNYTNPFFSFFQILKILDLFQPKVTFPISYIWNLTIHGSCWCLVECLPVRAPIGLYLTVSLVRVKLCLSATLWNVFPHFLGFYILIYWLAVAWHWILLSLIMLTTF